MPRPGRRGGIPPPAGFPSRTHDGRRPARSVRSRCVRERSGGGETASTASCAARRRSSQLPSPCMATRRTTGGGSVSPRSRRLSTSRNSSAASAQKAEEAALAGSAVVRLPRGHLPRHADIQQHRVPAQALGGAQRHGRPLVAVQDEAVARPVARQELAAHDLAHDLDGLVTAQEERLRAADGQRLARGGVAKVPQRRPLRVEVDGVVQVHVDKVVASVRPVPAPGDRARHRRLPGPRRADDHHHHGGHARLQRGDAVLHRRQHLRRHALAVRGRQPAVLPLRRVHPVPHPLRHRPRRWWCGVSATHGFRFYFTSGCNPGRLRGPGRSAARSRAPARCRRPASSPSAAGRPWSGGGR